eukprot:2612876-Prymnesium_polylepis.2
MAHGEIVPLLVDRVISVGRVANVDARVLLGPEVDQRVVRQPMPSPQHVCRKVALEHADLHAAPGHTNEQRS